MSTSLTPKPSDTWTSAFAARDDLRKYEQNALGLFALALRFGIDDLDSVAADSITDGSDDKKCDMIFINLDEGLAIVAQCYYSSIGRSAAPANKASDLNTAVAWLLQREVDQVPTRLQAQATDLRDAIEDGTVTEIQAWYIHNLPESQNVNDELQTVEQTIKSAADGCFAGKRIKASAFEIGASTLEEWYLDTQSPILVSDSFDIPIEEGFEVHGNDWSAFVTAMPAKFLYTVYRKHKTRLFSANVRDYLGSRRSDANINHGIKCTAEGEPANFWTYNNGLTILVHDYKRNTKKNKPILTVRGLSIVNGAQTTGAIGSLRRSPDPLAIVPARFVKTTSEDIIHNVIQFNNSQNRVTASDFRSNDRTQKRLREEMERIPNCKYEGGRRGGHADAIRRQRNLVPSYTAGQALAAFSGDPHTAYHAKSAIWASDRLYSKYFNENTNGPNLVFAYSLQRAVESRKVELVEKSRRNEKSLTTSEVRQLEFFRRRGSTFLLASAIASCLETIVGRRVANPARLSFGYLTSPTDAAKHWTKVIAVVVPFCHHLTPALTHGLKNATAVQAALTKFQDLVESTNESNRPIFYAFTDKVTKGTTSPIPGEGETGN